MKYKANLILNVERHKLGHDIKLFTEITHFIDVDSNGYITESHYVTDVHPDIDGETKFNPPRIWDKSLLVNYKLTPIEG